MFYSFIENIFEKEQTLHWLNKVKNNHFEKATVKVYGEVKSLSHIRNNSRTQFQSDILAQDIHNKIKELNDFPFRLNEMSYEKPSSDFRVYCYEPSEYFKPHKDGSTKEGDLVSQLTCLFYLNNTNGGETILMPEGYTHKDSHIIIQPKAGSLLIFEHPFWHEAKPVLSGQKYVMRTDLLYSLSY